MNRLPNPTPTGVCGRGRTCVMEPSHPRERGLEVRAVCHCAGTATSWLTFDSSDTHLVPVHYLPIRNQHCSQGPQIEMRMWEVRETFHCHAALAKFTEYIF